MKHLCLLLLALLLPGLVAAQPALTIQGTDLGTLGGPESYPTAINEQGQIIGASLTATGPRHAFMWQNGVMTDLGTLGGTASRATAINEQGQIIGESTYAKGEWKYELEQQHAFVWQNGVMTDLGTLGGTASRATAINEQGQIIGESTTATEERQAVLWTIQSPRWHNRLPMVTK